MQCSPDIKFPESGYSQLNHHRRGSQITRSKISYSLFGLIEPQPFSYTPAVTNSMQLQSKFTPNFSH